jgi:hypothetical protein
VCGNVGLKPTTGGFNGFQVIQPIYDKAIANQLTTNERNPTRLIHLYVAFVVWVARNGVSYHEHTLRDLARVARAT